MNQTGTTTETKEPADAVGTIRDNVAAFRGEDNVSMTGGWTDAAPTAE